MVRHTQTIRRLLPMNCLSVFDHFVGLALKRLLNPFQANVFFIWPFKLSENQDFIQCFQEVHGYGQQLCESVKGIFSRNS